MTVCPHLCFHQHTRLDLHFRYVRHLRFGHHAHNLLGVRRIAQESPGHWDAAESRPIPRRLTSPHPRSPGEACGMTTDGRSARRESWRNTCSHLCPHRYSSLFKPTCQDPICPLQAVVVQFAEDAVEGGPRRGPISLAVGETHGIDTGFTNPEGVEFGLAPAGIKAGYARDASSVHPRGQLGLRLGGGGFLPASGGQRFWRHCFIGKLNHHELGDKLFRSMQVEINGGAFGI